MATARKETSPWIPSIPTPGTPGDTVPGDHRGDRPRHPDRRRGDRGGCGPRNAPRRRPGDGCHLAQGLPGTYDAHSRHEGTDAKCERHQRANLTHPEHQAMNTDNVPSFLLRAEEWDPPVESGEPAEARSRSYAAIRRGLQCIDISYVILPEALDTTRSADVFKGATRPKEYREHIRCWHRPRLPPCPSRHPASRIGVDGRQDARRRHPLGGEDLAGIRRHRLPRPRRQPPGTHGPGRRALGITQSARGERHRHTCHRAGSAHQEGLKALQTSIARIRMPSRGAGPPLASASASRSALSGMDGVPVDWTPTREALPRASMAPGGLPQGVSRATYGNSAFQAATGLGLWNIRAKRSASCTALPGLGRLRPRARRVPRLGERRRRRMSRHDHATRTVRRRRLEADGVISLGRNAAHCRTRG